ncbi:MAG: hypothetical protein ABI540_02800 [Spartobacteria bacterium]
MKSRKLAIFGIGAWILPVASSAQDLDENYVAPTALIAISAIAGLAFTVMAVVRLWKTHKVTAVLFLASSLITLVYMSAPIKIINFLLFIWVATLLWVMGKHEGLAETLQKDSGLTSEECSAVQGNLQKGDHEAAMHKIALAQERHKELFKEATGVDVKDIIPEIGKEISWADIGDHAFRVFEFDRNGTTVDENNQVIAKSSFQPYGYLLVESPILNNRVRLPIIHRDDFLLAESVFDDPKLANLVESEELLVTYSPKHSGPLAHIMYYTML